MPNGNKKHKYNQELACRITDVFPGFKVLEAGGPGELHITEKIVIWIEEGVVKYIWDQIEKQWVSIKDRKPINHVKTIMNNEDL